MRQSWTDDRLDHLSERMDERFDHVERRFEQVDQRFEQVNQRFEQVDQRFDRIEGDLREMRVDLKDTNQSLGREIARTRETLHTEMHGLQRSIIQIGGGLIAANLTLTAALIGLVATHL